MTRVRAFYSDAYAAADVPNFARLRATAQVLCRADVVDIHAPPPFDPGVLSGLHAPAYLRAFHDGVEPLASSQGLRWSVDVREAVYAMLAGQLAAVRHAWAHGVAMNVACGFHHAVFERGSGFCAINGLALVAHAWPSMKVFVIDCDEHGGNGTEEFAARLPNLFNASMFGTRFGCNGHARSWPFEVRLPRDGRRAHLHALAQVERLLVRVGPDLVIYQAGADSHENDPKSRSGFSARALAERDLVVFDMVRRLAIPTVFVVAGGYQDPAAVALLNLATVRCAARALDRRAAALVA